MLLTTMFLAAISGLAAYPLVMLFGALPLPGLLREPEYKGSMKTVGIITGLVTAILTILTVCLFL